MSEVEQLKWLVSHDPCRVGDREPVGAVTAGAVVRIGVRLIGPAVSMVESADLLISHIGQPWAALPLERCFDGFNGWINTADYPHVLFYVFRLQLADGTTVYVVPRIDGRSTAGEVVVPELDGVWTDAGWQHSFERIQRYADDIWGLGGIPQGFQITVYDPQFAVPSWLPGSIMYQIFPDRFACGQGGVRAEGLAYHKEMGRPVHLHKRWSEPVEWRGKGKAYDPIDFFGGTLDGIREKLPYLASLGVEVLYLNPVFEARSNHRYDTADYERIDPLLGDEHAFRALARQAGHYGISIVLDAVLSHTGDDSRYFNARANYPEPGALQSRESPFHDWYDFSPQYDGAPYRSWWGYLSLPEVDERDPSWQRYIFGPIVGDGAARNFGDFVGVLPKWIEAGARGYRIDVADEIPDDVLARLRTSVKTAAPDAAIIGEVWEDATTKVSYGAVRTYALGHALDSVMNYPLREAVIGFALGYVDAQQLSTFFKSQQANYAPGFYECLMNLLSSHDVERIRTVLAVGGPIKHLPRSEQRKLASALTPTQDDEGARLQKMVVALLYALPGVPCIYYGDERGLHGGGDPFCRATFPWDDEAQDRVDCGADLTQFYQRMGTLRKTSAALRAGNMACYAPDSDTVCILRVSPADDEAVIAVVNRSDSDCHMVLDSRAPEYPLPAEARKALAALRGPLELMLEDAPAGSDHAEGICHAGMFDLVVPANTVAFLRIVRQ